MFISETGSFPAKQRTVKPISNNENELPLTKYIITIQKTWQEEIHSRSIDTGAAKLHMHLTSKL